MQTLFSNNKQNSKWKNLAFNLITANHQQTLLIINLLSTKEKILFQTTKRHKQTHLRNHSPMPSHNIQDVHSTNCLKHTASQVTLHFKCQRHILHHNRKCVHNASHAHSIAHEDLSAFKVTSLDLGKTILQSTDANMKRQAFLQAARKHSGKNESLKGPKNL